MHKLFVLAVVLSPAIAHADAAGQLGTDLRGHFNLWPTYRDDPGSRASDLKTDVQPAECAAAVAKARKAGLKDDARIFHTAFNGWDDAHYDKDRAYLSLAEIDAICKQWPKMVQLAPVAAALTEHAQTMKSYSLLEPKDIGPSMEKVFAKNAKDCFETVDNAIKAGAPPDHKVKIKDEVMSITEARSKVCVAFQTWSESLGKNMRAAHAADREQRAAPFKAVGISGEKLELFLEYDDVYWRGGANCQRIDDVKQLAKAKALFHWLENPDGTHTIRKYTFNGNKVGKPITKTYPNSAAAIRGCK